MKLRDSVPPAYFDSGLYRTERADKIQDGKIFEQKMLGSYELKKVKNVTMVVLDRLFRSLGIDNYFLNQMVKTVIVRRSGREQPRYANLEDFTRKIASVNNNEEWIGVCLDIMSILSKAIFDKNNLANSNRIKTKFLIDVALEYDKLRPQKTRSVMLMERRMEQMISSGQIKAKSFSVVACVGTPIDYVRGVDFFVVINDGVEDRYYYFDITSNREKISGAQDVSIVELDGMTEEQASQAIADYVVNTIHPVQGRFDISS